MTPDRNEVARWLLMRGEVYRRAGQHRRALVYLLMAQRLVPADVAILRGLVAAYIANDDGERALKALEALTALDDGAPYLHWLRSRALWSMGEHARAHEAFCAFLDTQGEEAC